MAFPDEEALVEAVLEVLAARGGTVRSNEVAELVAKRLNLTEADLNRRMAHPTRPNGESAWRQRLRRVRHVLVQTGKLSRGAGRGVWELASNDGATAT